MTIKFMRMNPDGTMTEAETVDVTIDLPETDWANTKPLGAWIFPNDGGEAVWVDFVDDDDIKDDRPRYKLKLAINGRGDDDVEGSE